MHIDIIEDKIASFEMSPSQVFTQMKQHIPEPVKPRVKVEYVKVKGNDKEVAGAFSTDKIYYMSSNSKDSRGAQYSEITSLDQLACVSSFYRKVETEIKTEKRWFAYNSKANIMETRGYKTKDDCYNTLQSNRFRDNFQYIEIDVEV